MRTRIGALFILVSILALSSTEVAFAAAPAATAWGVTFTTGDSGDSAAISNSCATWQGSFAPGTGGAVSIYAVATSGTATASGTLLGSWSGGAGAPTSFTTAQPYLKAKVDTAPSGSTTATLYLSCSAGATNGGFALAKETWVDDFNDLSDASTSRWTTLAIGSPSGHTLDLDYNLSPWYASATPSAFGKLLPGTATSASGIQVEAYQAKLPTGPPGRTYSFDFYTRFKVESPSNVHTFIGYVENGNAGIWTNGALTLNTLGINSDTSGNLWFAHYSAGPSQRTLIRSGYSGELVTFEMHGYIEMADGVGGYGGGVTSSGSISAWVDGQFFKTLSVGSGKAWYADFTGNSWNPAMSAVRVPGGTGALAVDVIGTASTR